jgi:prepilin-type N-terminal cleavage/methylation domain-containing protein
MQRLDTKVEHGGDWVKPRRRKVGVRGFTLPELLIGMVVASILAAVAIPLYNSAMTTMRLNETVNAISGAMSRTRYQAVMNSQVYTLTLTEPANTYVTKNVSTGVAAAAVPLPSSVILVNGGSAGTYTFTFCANGTVYGAGGVCPNSNAIPALALTYQTRETDISISGTGNVTSTTIH